MSQIPSISDAFRTVVAATEAAIIADASINWGTLPKKVYFMHGHEKEIVNVLQSFTNASLPKYPLVCLFRDIKEAVSIQKFGLTPAFNCRLVICTLTTPSLRANDREIQNFKPILLPIFEQLIKQISKSSSFGMPAIDKMKIVKWDRYFWGTQAVDKNILDDYIDAVEIESISLHLNNFC